MVMSKTPVHHRVWLICFYRALIHYFRTPQVSVSDILRRLKLCGWYWGELSGLEADRILENARNGSFIIRDSNDACHLFTLSLKAHDMVISVRVAFSRGLFRLDSSNLSMCPYFTSVVDLVEYYLADENRYFYVDVPEVGELLVRLCHPVLKEVASLQHLCRMELARQWRSIEEITALPLPPHLKHYLLEFCPLSQHKILPSELSGSSFPNPPPS